MSNVCVIILSIPIIYVYFYEHEPLAELKQQQTKVSGY